VGGEKGPHPMVGSRKCPSAKEEGQFAEACKPSVLVEVAVESALIDLPTLPRVSGHCGVAIVDDRVYAIYRRSAGKK
jgi:hypothetical protein